MLFKVKFETQLEREEAVMANAVEILDLAGAPVSFRRPPVLCNRD